MNVIAALSSAAQQGACALLCRRLKKTPQRSRKRGANGRGVARTRVAAAVALHDPPLAAARKPRLKRRVVAAAVDAAGDVSRSKK